MRYGAVVGMGLAVVVWGVGMAQAEGVSPSTTPTTPVVAAVQAQHEQIRTIQRELAALRAQTTPDTAAIAAKEAQVAALRAQTHDSNIANGGQGLGPQAGRPATAGQSRGQGLGAQAGKPATAGQPKGVGSGAGVRNQFMRRQGGSVGMSGASGCTGTPRGLCNGAGRARR